MYEETQMFKKMSHTNTGLRVVPTNKKFKQMRKNHLKLYCKFHFVQCSILKDFKFRNMHEGVNSNKK